MLTNDLLIPVKGIFPAASECAVAFIIQINIDESVALAHFACTGRDQIAQLPVEAKELADEIAAAEAHGKGEDHHKEGHFANRHNGADR